MDGQTTTQSKYIKQRKPDQQPEIAANEVRIKGNQGHVKRYVQYAWSLLEGTRITADGRRHDDDEKNDDGADAADKEPPQKFDTIVLKATGRAINKAVTTAEVVKRKIAGLHQETSLETLEITDLWEPRELGLKEVETKRRVASITIKLSRSLADVDLNGAGYQVPLPDNGLGPFPSTMMSDNRPRRRGPGYQRGGGGYGGGGGGYGGGGYGNRGGRRDRGGGDRGGRRGGPRGGGGRGRGGGRRGGGGDGGGSPPFDGGGGGGYGGGNRRGGYAPRSPAGRPRNSGDNDGGGGGYGGRGGYGSRGGRRGGPRGGGGDGGGDGGRRGGYNSRRNDDREESGGYGGQRGGGGYNSRRNNDRY